MRPIDYQIEDFLGHCKSKGLSVKSIKSYNMTLQLMTQYMEDRGITDAENIRAGDIDSYIRWLTERSNLRRENKPVSKITINGYIRNMKVFFNWMVEFEYIRKSPLRIKQFKVEREPLQFVGDKDFKKLLQMMDKSKYPEYRDSVIIQVLLDTGMRIGETLTLKDENINFRNNSFYLEWDKTKGKKSRTVYFGEKTRKVLKTWLRHRDLLIENTEYIFPNQFGEEFHINTFERNLRMYQQRIGLTGITPKTFRNNFAKRFLMNGGDIFTLSKILGHSSVTVTEKAYLDLTDDDIRQGYISPINRL
jgi:integrase/recombinase XerD